jgi:hypothetical protein
LLRGRIVARACARFSSPSVLGGTVGSAPRRRRRGGKRAPARAVKKTTQMLQEWDEACAVEVD